MTSDMSFFHLILGASFVVQLVMLLLLTVSMVSWTMIFRRRSVLKDARIAADEFEDRFWSGGDLATLFREVSAQSDNAIGMAGIFQSGFNEFARLRKQPGADPRAVVEGAQRVMRVQLLCWPVRYRLGHYEFISWPG
jgi:biopolymer transport protein TolQ